MINTDMITLGSHLSSERPGYTHHGIYVGGGKVVHYSGLANGLTKGRICQTTIKEFCQNQDKVTVVEYDEADVKFSPIAIVKRAKDRINENEYNLLFHNCEHFATWCVTGKSESKQVNRAVHIVTMATVARSTYEIHKVYQARKPVQHIARLATNPQLTGSALGAIYNRSTLSGRGLYDNVNVFAGTTLTGARNVTTLPSLAPIAARGIVTGFSGTGMVTAAGSGALATLGITAGAPVLATVATVAVVGYAVSEAWDWLTDW